MLLKINCSKCGKELNIIDSNIDPMGDITVNIYPCSDLDCRNCSSCETEQKFREVKEILK